MATAQHERFLGRLQDSMPAVHAVAIWLRRHDRLVEIAPVRFAPTAGDAGAFIDAGDLFVDADRKRIEVKQIRYCFYSRVGWPFNEVLISNAAAVERSWGVVEAYVTVSFDLKCAAVVLGSTRERWYLTQKRARNTGNVESYYACGLDDARFVLL